MQSTLRSEVIRRLAWVAGATCLWGFLISLRLLQLQVIEHAEYARQARAQQEQLVEIQAPRGAILDRNGQTLALSMTVDSVFVNPMLIPDIAVAADVLAPVLHLNHKELFELLKSKTEANRGFLWIKRRLTPEESAAVRSLRKGPPPLDWIGIQPETQRYYPKGEVAAHVLGSVDHAERGNAGVELSLEDELRGVAGKALLLTDVRGKGIESEMAVDPRPGTNLMLTIDERIQFAAERDLKAAVEGNGADSGSVVVMDPHNGEVLAMASYPTFNPNERPNDRQDLAARVNNALSAPFEPGSVFKVFTMAIAMESTRLGPSSVFPCGSLVLAGHSIGEAKHAFGPLTMAQVIEKSSNVGAAQAGLQIGQKVMYDYLRKFGFGDKTGVPLPGESSGIMRRLADWDKYSAAYMAFGHEIGTTTLQLAQACSTVVNGGVRVAPKVILSKQRPGSDPVAEKDGPRVPVLTPEKTIQMRLMMEGVVIRGTGKAAKLAGYSAGGKTGSAQIFDYEARHYTHNYNSSFMGFAPVGDPKIVVVVTVNGANKYGGLVAAPVFQTVSTEALRVLDVRKDMPETEDLPEVDPEQEKLEGTELTIAEAAAPVDMTPPPAPVPNPANVFGPVVPDFQGKTMRAVMEEAVSRGLQVVLDGKGIARAQAPPPGSILPHGEPIRVMFAR